MLKNLNFLNTLASSSLIRFHVQIKHYFGHEHISQHFHAISIFESSCLPSFVTSTATYILGDNLHFKTFELKISSQSKDTVLARIHNLEIEVRVLHGFDRTVTWTFQAFEKTNRILTVLIHTDHTSGRYNDEYNYRQKRFQERDQGVLTENVPENDDHTVPKICKEPPIVLEKRIGFSYSFLSTKHRTNYAGSCAKTENHHEVGFGRAARNQQEPNTADGSKYPEQRNHPTSPHYCTQEDTLS